MAQRRPPPSWQDEAPGVTTGGFRLSAEVRAHLGSSKHLNRASTRLEAAVPEADVVWVRDSTGVITARFLAEKDNPRADMIFGLAVTSLILFEKAGLLETYEPKGVGFVSVYSRSDAIVDWRACLDPAAEHVEVDASHIGMAVNAQAYGVVAAALERFDAAVPSRRARRARIPA